MKNDYLNYIAEGGRPIFSIEAEKAVLGAMLTDPECIAKVVADLEPKHFYIPQHKDIYEIIITLFENNKAVDFVSVLEKLKENNVFDEEQGKAYIKEIIQSLPSAKNIKAYVDILRERYKTRSLIAAASGILKDAKERMVDIDRIIDSAEQRLYEIRAEDCKQSPALIKNIIEHKVYNRLEKIQNPQTQDEFTGIPYGIERLDRITTGLNKSNLIVLASRPGFGKTTMALNIARNAAINSGKTVCFFSMEMSGEQITERLIGGESGIDRARLRAGKLTDDEKVMLRNAGERISKADLYIDDTPSITVNEIRAKLRKMRKVDLVIIDYLGLMRSFRKTYSPIIEMAEITRGLKILAKEFNIPVILCAQILHKTVKKRKVQRPTLNDLHNFIIYDADVILFLHRLPYFESRKSKNAGVEDNDPSCIIAKNPHGEIGTIPLDWDAEHLRFS